MNRNKKDVHSTMNSLFSGMDPVPFHLIEKVGSDWGEEDYENEILEGLKFCHDICHIPVSICYDWLPVQDIAVKIAIYIAETIDKKFILVVDTPCINHILHNYYIHSMKNSHDLQCMVNELGEIARYLRSPNVIQI